MQAFFHMEYALYTKEDMHYGNLSLQYQNH